ncbi:MAG: hemolysin family protein [Candidatus Omnitrophica bacterium]|nr:hemolysin family protein [Candidatus Omnitrophota bacterium]
MVLIIGLVVAVLLASGLCSMVEAAILSLPLMRAKVLLEEKRRFAQDVMAIKEDIHTAVATIVILNNAINIMGAIFVGQRVSSYFGSEWLGIFSAVLTFAIIVLSEIIPKTIGEHHKITVSLTSARTLRLVMWFFRPFIAIIILITKPFRPLSKRPYITEKEIQAMLHLGRDMGTIEVDEVTLINRVFKLNDLQAQQMMKPIDKICALPAGKTLGEAKADIISAPYSRLAVYEDDKERNIIGICQHRILLREIANDNYNAQIKEFMQKPIFVNGNERADNLLEKFRLYHQHLFIVRDQYNTNIGIITMEDVLEELFGEIYDEKDSGR